MEIDVTHHIDCSEIRPDGLYDWYYEYHMFRFTEGSSTFIVRAYVDTPHEAAFLSLQKGKKTRSLITEDLQLPLFQQAVNHLREVGKTSIIWLSPDACGYEPI